METDLEVEIEDTAVDMGLAELPLKEPIQLLFAHMKPNTAITLKLSLLGGSTQPWPDQRRDHSATAQWVPQWKCLNTKESQCQPK